MKVRKLIDGLPFTEEGYLKAKALLEKRYGQTSEVVGAYVRNILELPTIRERDVARIHDFYEKLLFNVESLLTLKKLNELDAAARFTFDKLEVIKNELALIDGNWRDWTFKEFLETLEKWTINNPLQGGRKQKAFFNQEERMRASRGCVYCTSTEHRAVNCTKVTDVSQRKSILASKRLCFNSTGPHRAALCKSQTSCHTCKGKHHTSICEKPQMLPPAREPGMTANHVGESAVIHPVVVVRVEGYKFPTLLDSGASHSYCSSTFVKLVKARPKAAGLRQIAMLMGVTTKTLQEFNVTMHAVTDNFQLDVSVTKIDKRELLLLENPRYEKVLAEHPHLRGVLMDDDDGKSQLPVHLILGANDFAAEIL